MRYSKRIVKFFILVVLYPLYPTMLIAQSMPQVTTVIAKVVDVDGDEVFNNSDFLRKAYSLHRTYYYAIQHFKIVTPTKDTFIIANVFNTRGPIGFSINKDSVYEFTLYNLRPCSSDFPRIIGCVYNGDSLYVPHKASVAKMPYSRILRIIDSVPIYHDLWMELCALYNKDKKL
jgi:hypothetical protein